MTKFSGLDLIEPLQRALSDQGYEVPTPIQAQGFPMAMSAPDLCEFGAGI